MTMPGAGERDDDEDEDFGPPLFGDEPTTEVDDPASLSFGDADTGPLPHWTEPPTGEIPRDAEPRRRRRHRPTTSTCGRRSPSESPVWSDDEPPTDAPVRSDDAADRRATDAVRRPRDDDRRDPSAPVPPRAGPDHHRHRSRPTTASAARCRTSRGRSGDTPVGAAGRGAARRRRAAPSVGQPPASAAATCRPPSPSASLLAAVVHRRAAVAAGGRARRDRRSSSAWPPSSSSTRSPRRATARPPSPASSPASPRRSPPTGSATTALPLVVALALHRRLPSAFIGARGRRVRPDAEHGDHHAGRRLDRPARLVRRADPALSTTLGGRRTTIGTDTLFLLALGVVANDVGALFVGSAVGKHAAARAGSARTRRSRASSAARCSTAASRARRRRRRQQRHVELDRRPAAPRPSSSPSSPRSATSPRACSSATST